ncbi:MAG: cupin domain-containing protein [Gemmatimonadetes bacterium]|nr:cupin domain-containing protein [Gemmatimonadota bacterium]NIR78631.1 cupin domain-containing protein [Gemmatimonadota bacterium]NIT87249.1 cupin domain-containing protein [Gemmatimonadota bacterium]NIU31092.1 cupin domain-containing protein [Gemmatimonadota bacterium]NIU35828.1 cupin domain-containing protein [Gemmatimonadota bacterium]
MSSLERPLSGAPLVVDLNEERKRIESGRRHESQGRTARTLVKDELLRVTLVTLGPGGEVDEHRAPGPITVQPLSGSVRFFVDGTEHEVDAGDLLALEAGIPHSVRSDDGCSFLLTVAHPAA